MRVILKAVFYSCSISLVFHVKSFQNSRRIYVQILQFRSFFPLFFLFLSLFCFTCYVFLCSWFLLNPFTMKLSFPQDTYGEAWKSEISGLLGCFYKCLTEELHEHCLTISSKNRHCRLTFDGQQSGVMGGGGSGGERMEEKDHRHVKSGVIA